MYFATTLGWLDFYSFRYFDLRIGTSAPNLFFFFYYMRSIANNIESNGWLNKVLPMYEKV